MATIVIPARNEGGVLGRLLGQLVSNSVASALNVLVVANGCSDNTAEVAASFGPAVRVISIPVASKYAAMAAADPYCTDYPRIYLDADVEMGAQDILELVAALRRPGVLAAGPERVLELAGRPLAVRWFYDVWMRLPEARSGLWGRGVIAVGEEGQRRIATLPPLIGDDLAASLLFAPHERQIVETARSIVHTPRTYEDLLRCRVRNATGVAQMERTSDAPPSTARTRPADLAAIVRREPRMAPRVAVFLAIAVAARFRSRAEVARGDYTTWHRDESTRNELVA